MSGAHEPTTPAAPAAETPPGPVSDDTERCGMDDCAEPATRRLTLSHRGTPMTLDVCREHGHDIDWGVIHRNSWLRCAIPLPPTS
ncbi:hypothetical protein [Subtercola boreus]|uniref:hypothetical protein n=1 Tax=Subtercola boreus TaxID=120213 RepID=UPI00114FAD21|nr:hypothetical protein [Subtercola boreus]TQL56080.1 hypothetical protein FB464_3660 [Subtercola boreus]